MAVQLFWAHFQWNRTILRIWPLYERSLTFSLFFPLSWQRNIVRISCNWLFLLLMTRGRIWDIFQPNWNIFKFYPYITFDLGFHGQNAVWKWCQHDCLIGTTFLCILIHEFPNTNKMGTGFYLETYRPTLVDKWFNRYRVIKWFAMCPSVFIVVLVHLFLIFCLYNHSSVNFVIVISSMRLNEGSIYKFHHKCLQKVFRKFLFRCLGWFSLKSLEVLFSIDIVHKSGCVICHVAKTKILLLAGKIVKGTQMGPLLIVLVCPWFREK